MFLEGGRLDAGSSKLVEFDSFPKIGRLFRDVAVTEKLDGSNAAVGVTYDGHVYAQSRKKLLSTDGDNFGFARWVKEHADELAVGLGPGLHFGEWWGLGINRGYGLDHKRFSLFNVNRWDDENTPTCCGVVPVLARLTFDTGAIYEVIDQLKASGSVAAPGFPNPEGVVVYHRQANHLYKVTIENDERGKEFGG